jgi:hypothetical protein
MPEPIFMNNIFIVANKVFQTKIVDKDETHVTVSIQCFPPNLEALETIERKRENRGRVVPALN